MLVLIFFAAVVTICLPFTFRLSLIVCLASILWMAVLGFGQKQLHRFATAIVDKALAKTAAATGQQPAAFHLGGASIGLLGSLTFTDISVQGLKGLGLDVSTATVGISLFGGWRGLVVLHAADVCIKLGLQQGEVPAAADAAPAKKPGSSDAPKAIAQLPEILKILSFTRTHIERIRLDLRSGDASTEAKLLTVTVSRVEAKSDRADVISLEWCNLSIGNAAHGGSNSGLIVETAVFSVFANSVQPPATEAVGDSSREPASSLEVQQHAGPALGTRLQVLLQSVPNIVEFQAAVQMGDTQFTTHASVSSTDGIRTTTMLLQGDTSTAIALDISIADHQGAGAFEPTVTIDGEVTSVRQKGGSKARLCEISSLRMLETESDATSLLELRTTRLAIDLADIDLLNLIRQTQPLQQLLKSLILSGPRARHHPLDTNGEQTSTPPKKNLLIRGVVAAVSLRLSLGGQLVEAALSRLSFDASETAVVSITSIRASMCSAQLLAIRNVVVSLKRHPRALTVKVDDLNFRLPHHLHFGNRLKEILTVIKALRLATQRGLQQQRGVASTAKPEQNDSARETKNPMGIEFLLTDVVLEVEDDPLDMWLNGQYLLLRKEAHEQHSCSRKLAKQLGARGEDVESERARAAFDLLAQNSAERYQKAVESADRSSKPLIGIRIKEGRLGLQTEEWASSYEKIVAEMQTFDSATFPTAATAVQSGFTDLLASTVDVEFHGCSVHIRDYCLPLLTAENLSLKGPVILAEQSVGPDFWSSLDVFANGSRELISTVIKASAPLKIYHSLQADISGLGFVHGTAYQPAIAELALALSRLSADSFEPSEPLKFWDKMRFMFHGTLKANVHRFSLKILATLSPHSDGDEHATITADYLNLDCISQNQWTMSIAEVNVFSTTKSDTIYFPGFEIRAEMQWNSLETSHFVHAFATNMADAFPNRNVEASLAELKEAQARRSKLSDIYSPFRSHSWSLKLNLTCVATRGEGASVDETFAELYTLSFAWCQILAQNFHSQPRSGAAIFKMPRTKIGNIRKKRNEPSLGALLQSFELRVDSGPLEVMLWNQDRSCLQMQLTGAIVALDVHSVSLDDAATKAVSYTVVASNLSGKCSTQTSPRPLRLCSCAQFSLGKHAAVTKSGQVNTSDAQQHLERLDIQISDILAWGSLENRNFIFNWIASAVVPKTDDENVSKPSSLDSVPDKGHGKEPEIAGNMLNFLASALQEHSADGELEPELQSEEHAVQKIGERFGLAVIVNFLRPQIRVKSEDGSGCMVITATEAMIDQGRHRNLLSCDADAEVQVVACSLQCTKLFAASDVHFDSDIGVSVEAVDGGSAFFHDASGAQQIMAPCVVDVTIYKWSPRPSDHTTTASAASAAAETDIALKMKNVDVAMNAEQFSTLKDAISMLTSPSPHLQRLAQEKKRMIYEQQLGTPEYVSAELGLQRTLEDLEAAITKMELSAPDNERGLQTLHLQHQACVQALLGPAKEVQHGWHGVDKSLELNVDIGDVNWSLLSDPAPIASVQLKGIKLRKDLFSDTASVVQASVHDMKVARPGQVDLILQKIGQPAALGSSPDLILRVLAKQAAPVGGVNVYDLLEINLQPVRIALTQDLLVEFKHYMFGGSFVQSVDPRTSLWQPTPGSEPPRDSTSASSMAGLVAAGKACVASKDYVTAIETFSAVVAAAAEDEEEVVEARALLAEASHLFAQQEMQRSAPSGHRRSRSHDTQILQPGGGLSIEHFLGQEQTDLIPSAPKQAGSHSRQRSVELALTAPNGKPKGVKTLDMFAELEARQVASGRRVI
jgi:hypothetical protein